LLGIVVATALWAVSNSKKSSRIDGPQGRGYSASRAGGFCFAPAQVDIWRRAGAGDAGQLQLVLRGHTRLQSA
jgi:hypothetical protein